MLEEEEKKEFCTRPFEEIEIHAQGEIYTCCPNWNNFYDIGNLHKNKIEKIWNSKKAKELRKRILKNDYSLCGKNGCTYSRTKQFFSHFNTNCKEKMNTYPLIVKLCYDYECNIACKFCRGVVRKLPDDELEILNSKIDTFFLPLLKSAKILLINANGDPFGSRHSRLLIKKAAQKYPDLKFDFQTNGTLCNETVFKNLNITPEKIEKIRISVHAATKETYGKIVDNGEFYFPKIIENLEYINKIRKESYFELFLHFVVNSLNYKEMPAFVEFAQKYEAFPCFWELKQEICPYLNLENIDIVNKNHPMHNDLLKVLKEPILLTYKEKISPVLMDLITNQ